MPSRPLEPFIRQNPEALPRHGSAADACTAIAAAVSSEQAAERAAEALRRLTGVDASLVCFDDEGPTAASPSSELASCLAQIRTPKARKMLHGASTASCWALEQLDPSTALFVLPTTAIHTSAVFLLHATEGLSIRRLDTSLLRQLAQCAAMTLSHHALERMLFQQAEQLKQSQRDRDAFIGAMSHELRSPLNALLGWARLVRGGSLSEEHRAKALETIERNACVQATLLDDMLDFSRVQSELLTLETSELCLSKLVISIVEQAESIAETRGIELSATIAPSPSPLCADATRLGQIIKRLLNNALRFTARGGRVHVALSYDDAAQIVIDDSGRGLSHEQIATLFDGPKASVRGFGSLGLRVTRHVIERHGGSINVRSEGLGRGTQVTVRLPLGDLTETATAQAAKAAEEPPSAEKSAVSGPPMTEPPSSRMQRRSLVSLQAPPSWLAGLRLLVVEDEPDAREMLVSMLSHCRAEVRAASSAAEALSLLDQRLPDVIISDIGMPGEDGYSLLRKVRARPASRGGTVPAIALTAFTRYEDRARALACGYQAHLAKPADLHALLLAIADVTGRTQSDAG